ncbi:EAL domain-containing protein [Actinoplanes sp. Pm04-4]|uniref:EAL domain-containing protein n=1 Tax=Paractinoplanes pyxinae TaxID=2997416 RepID=A0ABT4B022_9ACTN|nr:EAL domain-containing protein [Actinoplanes pyxinae]MCY1139799.1 EAL domain-containing protein [Actinoplanes pyxinae]
MANQRFAVMVGVDDAGSRLRFAERDAEAMRDQFAAEGFETCLFTGADATAGEIKATLRQAVMRAGKSDVLVVYFAGGTVTPEWSRGADTYLITHDLDESALSENPDSGVRMAFLERDVLEFFPGTAVLIIDAVGDEPEFLRPTYSALASYAGDAAGREDAVIRHGVLTAHILATLRRQQSVTFGSLAQAVRDQGLTPRVMSPPWGEGVVLAGPADQTGLPASRPLANPMDAAAGDILHLIGRLTHHARMPRHAAPRSSGSRAEAGSAAPSRVEYLRAATDAHSTALLEYTPNGFQTIDSSKRFDLDVIRPMLRFPPGADWFGHTVHDDHHTVLCVPLRHAEGRSLLLALVDPAVDLLGLGQPLAKILETIWRTDFAASPDEAEIEVLTALRGAFGRLPVPLYEHCFELYQRVLESYCVVFQPVVTLGKTARRVGVHSYEALARRSPSDQRAPVAMLRLAEVWGDRFVVERDKVILRMALRAYAQAHAEGPWAQPKPVSINVAVRSLLSDAYVDVLRTTIAELAIDPRTVTLEISEQDPIEPRRGEQWAEAPHAYFHNRLAAIARDVGVAFAVDDFGEGYASLSRMAELPLTQIKVDRAILHHPLAAKELSLVMDTARYAGHAPRVVIVEGVDDESPLTLREIYEQRIRHVQGYITRQPAAPTLSTLSAEASEYIAALVRGDDEHRDTLITRADDLPLQRGA